MLDLDAYLDRIGLGDVEPPCLELLQAVVRGHVMAIPFENLDIVLGRPVPLDIDAIQAKLVKSRRGGYCFEQNTLLRVALEALGFQVSSRMARVVRGSAPGTVTPRTHMFLHVALPEGAYLADVGFGNLTPTAPLRLEDNAAQPTGHEPFRIARDARELCVQTYMDEAWTPLYRFLDDATFPVDHEVANWFTSTRPGGKFTANGIAALPGPGCRKTLLNGSVTIRHANGDPHRFSSADSTALRDVLHDHFNIELTATEAATAFAAMRDFAQRQGPRFD